MASSATGSDRTQRLGVRLLGEFRLEGADVEQLKSRQARTVLKRLALAEGAAVAPDTLAEAVWGTAGPTDPARDLYVLISRARRLVGADRLVRRDHGYALLADSWDRADLVALIRDAARRRDHGDLVGAGTAAEAAVALVRGPLLADGPDADWVLLEREALAPVITEARQIAAEAALATGRIGDAVDHARAALLHDPYDEAAVRVLLLALVAAGRPASALAEYASLRQRLTDELGVDPSPATRSLHERILRGELPESPPSPPINRLVGRESSLHALDDALVASTHAGKTVLVTGEPGIGKTALLDRWNAEVCARGVIVLTARAEPGCLSLQPVLDALANRLGAPTELESAVVDVPVQNATAEALMRRALARVDGVLAELIDTASRGLALLIDDAHEADPLTWRWLTHVLRRPADHRFLLVLAFPGFAALPRSVPTYDLLTASGGARRIELGPLGRDAVARLVDPDRADELLARSGGNPLLVTELARALPSEEVPGTVRETVTSRLRRCGAAVPTLQTAAILAPTIDLDLLAGVLDAPPLQLLDHLDQGVHRYFLAERQGALAFRHELVRLAVAADAGPVRQAWVHRRAAELLWQRPDPPATRVAAHARAGGDPGLTAQALARAADLAAGRLDLAAAERHLDEALRLHDSAELHLRRSRIRMARGDIEGADADAQAAMPDDTTGAALELRTWAARNRHDLAGAIRLGTAAVARAADPLIKASSQIALAFAYRGTGDLAAADRVLAEASADAPADLGIAAWVGVLRVHQGRPVEALAGLEPALGEDAARRRQAYWVEHTLQMTAHAYGLLGRPVDALRVLDRLAVELERRGTVSRYAGVVHTYRSWVLRNLGAAAEATDQAHGGLELGATPEVRSQCHLDIADCLLRDQRLDAAEARLTEAEREAGHRWFHNRWRFDLRLGAVRARLALAGGDPNAAADAAAALTASALRCGDRRYQVLGRLLSATAEARLRPGSVSEERLVGDLERLAEVAALEGWWLAADVADATGAAAARHAAENLATRLVRESGDRAAAARAAVAARLS